MTLNRAKAVSDGAISFYLDRHVRTRVAKVAYGSFTSVRFDEADPDHIQRSHEVYLSLCGRTGIKEFHAIIAKVIEGCNVEVRDDILTMRQNTKISETKEFKEKIRLIRSSPTGFCDVQGKVWCYRGIKNDPRWRDLEPENYSRVCKVVGDLSHLTPRKKKNPSGGIYYSMDVELVIMFGLTEIQAQLAWMEDGTEKRSPAKIVYEQDS